MKSLFVLSVVMINTVNGQVPPDTSGNYKQAIDQLISKEANRLMEDSKTDVTLFKQIFEPCNSDGDINKMLDNFFSLLDKRMVVAIQNIFSKGSNKKYFGKRTQEYVIEYTKNEIGKLRKAASTNKQPTKPGQKSKVPNTPPIRERLIDLCKSKPPNTAPFAVAGGPITITLPTDHITLNGSLSYDNENNIVSYQWQKLEGKGPPFFSAASASPIAKVTGLLPGNYKYVLTVTDSENKFGRDTLGVTVKPQLLPPIVKAGGPYLITLPNNKVRLSGSIKDPNDLGVISKWEIVGGGNNIRIVSSDKEVTDIENLPEGTFQFQLTATNKAGLSASDIAIVTVNPRPNKNPKVEAGEPQTITLPLNTVTLHGQASDQDGDRITTLWQNITPQLSANIVSKRDTSTDVKNLEAGEYRFVLTANDGHNGFASDTVIIKVNPEIPKKPPHARAGDDQNKNVNDVVTLTGNAIDDDGIIVSYQWKMVSDSGKYHIKFPLADTTQVTGLEAGTYEFELTVTDNDGLTGRDRMILKIDGFTTPPPPPPTPVWIWIVIGIAVAGVSSYTYYILWWRRQRKKLIVYFMNKEEEALAHELMPGYKNTEGYILGHSTQAKIKEMKKKGLALRVLNTTVLTVHTPGATRTYKYSIKKGEHELVSVKHESPGYNYVNIITDEKIMPVSNNMAVPAPGAAVPPENELPAFYIITLDAPLLPIFSEQLEGIGISVLQRVPYDSYIIRVKEHQQLDMIRHDENFRFIRMIKQYTADDTGFTVRKDHFANAGKSGPDVMLVIDLVLHREEDAPLVRDFLGSNHIELIASYRNTIRVRVPAGNDIAYKLSSNKYIQAIYEHIPPVMHNDIARQLVNIDIAEQQSTAFEEDGTGETIAVADTGIDKQHPDFSPNAISAVVWGRKATNDTSDPHGHGTHVTGTIIGNGTASQGQIKGIAPGATIFFQSLLDENEELCDLELQLPELLQQAYENNARILNISWGSATESYYTFDSAMIDQFVYDNQEMLVVVSAGNEAANRKDKNGNPLPGFGTVGSPATTKNGVTVGASNSKRDNGDAESMALFSSRGPCRPERRIKPDIVAPGTNILSAKSSEAPDRNFASFYKNPAYVFLEGTSMATPIVSGAAAMVREYYKKKRDHTRPAAALIKATLLNGTHQLSGTSAMLGSDMIPNNNQGYGMLDMKMTIPNKQADFKLWFCDSLTDKLLPFNKAGERRMFRLQLKQKSWLRVCMVFMDNPRMNVQSDLNLLISLESTITKWKGNAGINLKDEFYSNTEEDFTNNIEIVRIENAEPGSYLIEAVADNVAPAGNVGFAIVITTGDKTSDFSTVQP